MGLLGLLITYAKKAQTRFFGLPSSFEEASLGSALGQNWHIAVYGYC